MCKVKLVDSRMGRGKTSAAIGYMKANPQKRFVYITPFLDEVDRICERCEFDQPGEKNEVKIVDLKRLLHQKRNIATTHALYYNMDSDALDIIRGSNYTLIVDESIETVTKLKLSPSDLELVTTKLATVDEGGFVHWKDKNYSGIFNEYKKLADVGALAVLDSAMFAIMDRGMLEAFDEVIMMSYLFAGQTQKAYLDFYGFDYTVCGIDDSNGYQFTDHPDAPPPMDYKGLITILDNPKMNEIGKNRCSLSANWYKSHSKTSLEIKELRRNMHNFFNNITGSKADDRLWTCFIESMEKLDRSDKRYKNSFLQSSARATNQYRDRKYLAYMINRFPDPNVIKFFAKKGITIDANAYALGEMLQWIWRSRIRDNKPIELYIPSKRMRDLLIDWIDKNSKGDNTNE